MVSLAALAVCAMLALGLFLTSVGFDPELFAADAAVGRGTVFTDRRGRELRFLPDQQGERGRWSPLGDIPVMVRNAFIAAEDERFFRHHGFDGIAILRALWANSTKGRVVSGASTISQQVIRMGYADAHRAERGWDPAGAGRTYHDKLVEIVRSVKLERMFTKDEILEQYLNRVPMGNNLVGVETASRAYFGVPAEKLSASEAALLASLPKAPTRFNPYGDDQDRLLRRRNWVLGRMADLGFLSEEQAQAACRDRLQLRGLVFASAAPHVVDMLLQQNAAGARVRTTIDLDLQQRVQRIVSSHAERLRYRGATQAAAIVIENATMEVLASVGSMEYSDRNGGFNNGVRAYRSAGSTLKPFLYGLALESGETVSTLLEDTERTYRSREGQYSPLNFDRTEYGPVKLRSALGSSLNLSAVKMLQRVGEQRFYDLLVRLDLINHPERGPDHYGLGMAIGNPEVSPEQLAAAYAALANRGVYRKAVYIAGRGAATGAADHLFLPQTAYIVTDMLADSTARMLTFNRSRVMMDQSFPVAMKTGTSTFYRDLWTAGFTPDYTVAVWVGNFDGSPTKSLSGSSAAGPIFSDIMAALYRHAVPAPFPRPKGVRRAAVCGYSGMRPTSGCGQVVKECFIAGTEPKQDCTFHTARTDRHELAAPYAGWLFEKAKKGSAGRFRLSGFGDDLGAVFRDPWEGREQEEPAVRARGIEAPGVSAPAVPAPGGRSHYSIGASLPADERPRAAGFDAPISIIYPLDRDRFVRDRFSGGQTVLLQAAVADPVEYVEWYVNGRLYKRAAPPYQAVWPLAEGQYRITAVTPHHGGDSVRVTVE